MSDQPPVVGHVRNWHAPTDIYIGRKAITRWGNLLGESVFANPFRLSRGHSREEVLKLYESLMRQRLSGPEADVWKKRILSLTNKRLGCWCSPAPCHGDILVKLWHELQEKPTHDN